MAQTHNDMLILQVNKKNSKKSMTQQEWQHKIQT